MASRGEDIYKKKMRKGVLGSHVGGFAAIDVSSREHFLGDTLIEAYSKAKQCHPGHKFHFVRIGHGAAVSFKHRTRP